MRTLATRQFPMNVRFIATLLTLGSLMGGCAPDAPPTAEPPAQPPATSSAALVGTDGAFTVTAANTVLNTYAALQNDAAAGATSIRVATIGNLDSPQFGPLAAGDLLMIIQMQGATIATPDTVGYGAVTALNSAGLYELVSVASVAGNGTITLNPCAGGLKNSYSVAGRAQVVRVPQLTNLTVNNGASITALPWDGARGGVVALQVQGALNLNGNVDVTAAGFRGGAVDNDTSNGAVLYRSPDSTTGGEKGEGIAGDVTVYDASFGGRYGRGAAANGGGGGDAHNAGGGGGANGNNSNVWTGQGVMNAAVTGAAAWALDPGYIANGNARTNSSGGGRAGYTYSASNLNALTQAPGVAGWGGDSRREVGGLGGRPVNNDPASRLFLGGGGGAGDGNNNASAGGGRGGGLVWVVADTVAGSGRIVANGQNAFDTIGGHNDAPGGGGAGGTVVVAARALSGIAIDANGGRGGDQLITTAEAEGPGGGGGGGYIAVSGGTVTRSAVGGRGGTTTSTSLTEFPANGATDGAAGQAAVAVVPGSLPMCAPSDLSLTLTDGVTTVVAGSTVTYTLTVTNNGPNAATGAQVTDTFPAVLTGVTWTCTPAAACATTSGTGNISALVNLASGAVATFTATGTLSPSATGTLTNTASVTPPVTTTDSNLANNSATDTDTVTSSADLSVALTAAPEPVNEGGTLTYSLAVSNVGPSRATSVSATLNLPAGATFVSAAGTGWTCSQSGGVVTCTRPTLDPGSAPSISVQVTLPGVAGSITATGSVSSTTADPAAGNNSVSRNTTVSAVNDGPVNTVPGAQSVAEDGLLVFSTAGGNALSVSDVDVGAADIEVTLTAGNGVLTLSGVTGLTFSVGTGTANPTMTFRGTQANVNAALNGLRFAPTANFNGAATLTVVTNDLGNTGSGGALSDTDAVAITVIPVNDAPTAVNDSLTVNEDSAATVVDVLANDSFAPDTGETLTVTEVTQPANGTVTLTGGVVRFTPAPDFNGTTSFTYTLTDGTLTATATVTVTVTAVNDPVVAANDTLTVAEDSAATVADVLANDSFAPDTGETLTVTAVTQPANGTVTLTGGVVSFTPAPDFNGTTSFDYTVSDGTATATATVTVTVTPVNDPPTAANDVLTVAEDSAATVVNVLANDSSSPDMGETLTITAVSQPARGTVELVGSEVRFTPAPDFSGTVTFTYTVSDGTLTTTATVTVTVTPVNDAPVAANDSLTVDEDSAATVVDVLANDSSGPDTGETLTVTAVTQPANGTVTLTGGVVRFTPAPDFNGTTSFDYTLSDGALTATATVTVTVTPVNDPPVAANDSLTVNEDSAATVVDVLVNDSFAPDTGETLTVTAVSQPSNGTVELVGGEVRFTPVPDFNGTTSFTYTVSDGRGGEATATVTVTVNAVNDAPVAANDTVTVDEDSGATVVNVLANDSTGPDTGETLTVTAVTQPANGTVELVGGEVRFTPAPDFSGTTSFTYTVSDGALTATATVTVTVTPVNDAPVAVNDTLTVDEDSGATVVDVLANDSTGPDSGETVTVTVVTQPANGMVELVGGEVRFTPAPDFSGTTSFTYTVSDDGGSTMTATVSVTVNAVNDAPVHTVPGPQATPEETPLVFSSVNALSVSDVDALVGDLSVTLRASGGTLTLGSTVDLLFISGDGTADTFITFTGSLANINAALSGLTWTPDENFTGSGSITLTTNDQGNTGAGEALSDSDTVTITVQEVNDAPVVGVPGAQTLAEDSSLTFSTAGGNALTVSDVDVGAGQLRVTLAVDHGTLSLASAAGLAFEVGDGTGDAGMTFTGTLEDVRRALDGLRFEPDASYTGAASLTFTVDDQGNTGSGGPKSASATVDLTVTPVNDAPTAVDDTATVDEDAVATSIDVLANDSIAPDTGETLSLTAVTQGAHGTVAINGSTVTYQPEPDFNGTDTFTYTVSDGNGGTATATVTVTVTPVNDAPIGNPDMFSAVRGGSPMTLPVLANDSSGPDTGETLTVSSVTQPAHGSVVVSPDGSAVVFTPPTDFVGLVTFEYTVSDGNGGTATAVVTVNVAPPDSDNDGLTDDEELVLGTDPRNPDSDNDGLNDSLEVTAGTDPKDDDSDDDGLLDGNEDANHNGVVDAGETMALEADTDGDGLSDGLELGLVEPQGTGTDPALFTPDADPSTTTDPLLVDTDGGSVHDGVEDKNHNGRVDEGETDPLLAADDVDADGDGIDNATEVELGTNPFDTDTDDDGVMDATDGLTDTDKDGVIDALDADSDNDGVLDGTERGVTAASAPADTNTASPNFRQDEDPSTTTDPRDADTDGDGLNDGAEDASRDGRVQTTETDPNNPDTDGDALSDGLEVTGSLGTNPLDKDTDDDGLEDGVEDANHDGRRDSSETDPTLADTDQGGVNDGDEVRGQLNPLDDTDDFLIVGHGCGASGAGTLAPLALLLLALPMLRRNRSGGPSSRPVAAGVAGLLLLAVALLAGPARASDVSQAIDVQQYKPGPGSGDILGVHSARVAPHLGWSVGLSVNYADKPLNLFDPLADSFAAALVKNQVGADLMGSLGLFGRLELGVVLPVTLQSSEPAPRVHSSFAQGVGSGGVGDLRLVPKARLVEGESFGLALAVPVVLPTAGGRDFLGGEGVGVQPRLVAEYGKAFRIAANLGVDLRRAQQLRNLNTGNALAFGLGAELPFHLGRLPLAAEATVVGALGLEEQDTEERPLELLAALKYRSLSGLSARVGAGPGLTRGYGTPGFRVLAGLSYSPVPSREPKQEAPPAPVDSDGDGRVDGQDGCPAVAEDQDGFEDTDGCADPDNDQDGIADTADACINQPETKNAHEDSDGCPDEAPPVDTDGDGLTDDKDRCPAVAEDQDGFEDADGCADPDNDKDGIADTADACVNEPELINGVKDEDGCPDQGKVKVQVDGERILILEKVYFATSKDVILPRSFPLLKQVAAVLRANPQVELLRIEGHTDSQGNDAKNLDLSKRRAASVRAFLVKEGIAPERLEAEGYGETKPVDTNKTAAGRENNRRVEFTILRVGKVEVEREAP